MNKHVIAAGLTAVALAVPAGAAADPGHGKNHGHGPATERVEAKHEGAGKKARTVKFVFRGSFSAPGTIEVRSGNAHVRKGGFVGQTVTFDLSNARVVVADTNGDGQRDVTDVRDGDLVLVQARLAKGTAFAEGAAAIVARRLIDHAPSS